MSKTWLPITWENIGRRIKQLLSSESNLIEIGTIDFEDLNDAYTAEVEDFTFVFTDAKPTNVLFIRPVLVVTESIVSYSGVTVTGITGSEEFIFATANDKSPNVGVADISVNVSLSAANANDWTSGKVKVYILVSPYNL